MFLFNFSFLLSNCMLREAFGLKIEVNARLVPCTHCYPKCTQTHNAHYTVNRWYTVVAALIPKNRSQFYETTSYSAPYAYNLKIDSEMDFTKIVWHCVCENRRERKIFVADSIKYKMQKFCCC